MFANCIFCQADFGGNAVLEEFPVGRRLAFDPAKGRLWVVCRKCERWNLSPLEERWEAIEAADRLFSDTRMRVSTENIGLARHREGLELVRIGAPQRPEFAAWRYGDQFGRRRRRAILYGAGAVGVVGTIAVAGVATGVITGAFAGQFGNFFNLWFNGRTLVQVRTEDGQLLKLKRPHLHGARLRRDGEGWSLVIDNPQKKKLPPYVFEGPEAHRVAGLIMPRINAGGAGKAVVQEAVREIERIGGPHAFLDDIVTNVPLRLRPRTGEKQVEARIGKMATTGRLALEMALHEEQERRALEGELKDLELMWRAEEEIASIADDLLLPEDIQSRIDAEKRNNDAEKRNDGE